MGTNDKTSNVSHFLKVCNYTKMVLKLALESIRCHPYFDNFLLTLTLPLYHLYACNKMYISKFNNFQNDATKFFIKTSVFYEKSYIAKW